jgi:tetratricopeptide (TPR) repeat protein
LNNEYSNIRAALRWCRETAEENGIGARFTAVLWIYWIRRGLLGEGLSWIEAMLARPDGASPDARAEALCGAGVLRWVRGDNHVATARLDESVTLWRATGQGLGLGRALHYRAALAREHGDLATARRLCQESVELFRQANSRWDLAVALCGLGTVARLAGRTSEATSLYEEAVGAIRPMPDPWILSFTLRHLAALVTSEHQYERAEAHWRESVILLQGIEEDPRGIAQGLEGMAAVLSARREHPRAIRLIGAAGALRAKLETTDITVRPGELERLVGTLNAEVGEQAFKKYWTEGHQLSRDEAISLALIGQPPTRSDQVS